MDDWAYVVPPEHDRRVTTPSDAALLRKAQGTAWWRVASKAEALAAKFAIQGRRAVPSRVLHRDIGEVLGIDSKRIRHGYLLRLESLGMVTRTPNAWMCHPEHTDVALDFGIETLTRLYVDGGKSANIEESEMHDRARSFARRRLSHVGAIAAASTPPDSGSSYDPHRVRTCETTPAYRTAFELRLFLEVLWPLREGTTAEPSLVVTTQWMRDELKRHRHVKGAEQIQRFLALGTALGIFDRRRAFTMIRFRFAPLATRWCWLRLQDSRRLNDELLQDLARTEFENHARQFGEGLDSPAWQTIFDSWQNRLHGPRERPPSKPFVVDGKVLDVNPPHLSGLLSGPPTLGERLLVEAQGALESGALLVVHYLKQQGNVTRHAIVNLSGVPRGEWKATVDHELVEWQPDFVVVVSRSEIVVAKTDDSETIVGIHGSVTLYAGHQRLTYSAPMEKADSGWRCSWWRPNPAYPSYYPFLDGVLAKFELETVTEADLLPDWITKDKRGVGGPQRSPENVPTVDVDRPIP